MGCGCQGTSYSPPEREARRQERLDRLAERRANKKVAVPLNDPGNFARNWDPPKTVADG